MTIRTATIADLDSVSSVESLCFPSGEAFSRDMFARNLRRYPGHFWLMCEGSKLISFVHGLATNLPNISERMYTDAQLHVDNGRWQMICGVDTPPAYRCCGYARQLLQTAMKDASRRGKKGLVLACKDNMIPYYASVGFVDEGVRFRSAYDGLLRHQMRWHAPRRLRKNTTHVPSMR
ncbi:MAG: GNAT family N-acetyltransferase [Desulfovibrio sp.]|nr:GNAT family N-acetyltransferase [Desulfovibrio sp.]